VKAGLDAADGDGDGFLDLSELKVCAPVRFDVGCWDCRCRSGVGGHRHTFCWVQTFLRLPAAAQVLTKLTGGQGERNAEKIAPFLFARFDADGSMALDKARVRCAVVRVRYLPCSARHDRDR
jgi:hypothetical protein